MINDTMMTIVGNVCDEPVKRITRSGHAVANLRVASTPRYYDRGRGAGPTADAVRRRDVLARLAEHVRSSVHKGDPIVVTGRYTSHTYEVNEQLRYAQTLEAFALGHDLSRGTRCSARRRATSSRMSRRRERRAGQRDRALDRCGTPTVTVTVTGCGAGGRGRGRAVRRGRRPGARGGQLTDRAAVRRPAGTAGATGPVGCRTRRGWDTGARCGARGAATATSIRRTDSGPVHLHHVQGAQVARRQGDSRRRDLVVPARRQDRCRRPERCGQVERAQDHGRPRPGLQW